MSSSTQAKFVSTAWLVAATLFLVSQVYHLQNLPSWNPTVRGHFSRYPSEILEISVAFVVALVAAGTLTGNTFAAMALRGWCWVCLFGSASLFSALVVITFMESMEWEIFGFAFLAVVFAASVLSLVLLKRDARPNLAVPADPGHAESRSHP